jgi:hypothetical protein
MHTDVCGEFLYIIRLDVLYLSMTFLPAVAIGKGEFKKS